MKSLKEMVSMCKTTMKKLGALIIIVTDANITDSGSPLNVEDLLKSFGDHVDADLGNGDVEEDEAYEEKQRQ